LDTTQNESRVEGDRGKNKKHKEKAHKTNESINTLPPVERMMKIMENRQLYNEIEHMKVE
jgi:hypothetical protein